MKKIQTKIITMIVLATVCVSFTTGLMGMLVTRYSTTAAIEKNLRETADLAALAAQNMISTYTLTIAEIASNPTLVDDDVSLEEKQAFMSLLLQHWMIFQIDTLVRCLAKYSLRCRSLRWKTCR